MKRTSLRDSIDAKCRSCIYDDLSAGTWREQVACCSSSNCPLFDVRPLPANVLKRGELDREALRALQDRLDGPQNGA